MGLVLASASPRRRELLELLGLEFSIEPASIDETTPDGQIDLTQIARDLAVRKAAVVTSRRPEAVVLAADTLVALDDRLLGKPVDAADARRMLAALRGRVNQVVTGVAVGRAGRLETGYALTNVKMRVYSDADIANSVARGTPFDKAGGYAIQDSTLQPVEAIDGCHCNVIGLPLALTIRLLAGAGVQVPNAQPERLLPQCPGCPLFKRD